MKNTTLTLCGIGLLSLGFMLGSNHSQQKESLPGNESVSTNFGSVEQIELKSPDQQGVIFVNEKVVVKYFEEEKFGGFDVLVETRNGFNVSSEWDMVDSENHSFAYLVGSTKEHKKEFHEMNLEKLGYKFQWEENYEIEGVDVPYNLPK